jgi:protein-S-isoprenylcysteine O-methyltransferase Ste14
MLKLISKFTLLITILVILYLLISGNLFSASPFVIAGQVLAVALSVWSRRSFQQGQFSIHAEPAAGVPLLRTGPYQFIRHPMYASALLLVWSGILGHWSILNSVIGLIVTGAIAVRIIVEERFLQSIYPDYLEYSRKTRRIVPFII